MDSEEIRVFGIDYATTENSLVEFFIYKFGLVDSTIIERSEYSGMSIGTCVVRFKHHESINKVLEINHVQDPHSHTDYYFARKTDLRIPKTLEELQHPYTYSNKKPQIPGENCDPKTIVVRNIVDGVSRQKLRLLFNRFGMVRDVKIPIDQSGVVYIIHYNPLVKWNHFYRILGG